MNNQDLKKILDLISDFWDTETENKEELENACKIIYDTIWEKLTQNANAWAIPQNVLDLLKNEGKSKGKFDNEYCRIQVEKIWNYRKTMFSTLKFTDEHIKFVEKTLINDLKKFAIVDVILHFDKSNKNCYKYIVNLGKDICLKFKITIDDKVNNNICLGGLFDDFKIVNIDNLEERLS